MRFWNFVVNCIALPVNSTIYAAGSQEQHANGAGGADRYRLAPQPAPTPQPEGTRPRANLRVVN